MHWLANILHSLKLTANAAENLWLEDEFPFGVWHHSSMGE